MRRHGLHLNAVEHFPALQGGTLRWRVGRREAVEDSARDHLAREREQGLTEREYYAEFGARVDRIRVELRDLLTSLRADGRTIAAYGAAAKGSTLMNYCEIGPELVDFVVDRNVHKHGLHMPGTHQPIGDPALLLERQPDYVLLLAWNYHDEVAAQQAEYLRRGGRFILPVPTPRLA